MWVIEGTMEKNLEVSFFWFDLEILEQMSGTTAWPSSTVKSIPISG